MDHPSQAKRARLDGDFSDGNTDFGEEIQKKLEKLQTSEGTSPEMIVSTFQYLTNKLQTLEIPWEFDLIPTLDSLNNVIENMKWEPTIYTKAIHPFMTVLQKYGEENQNSKMTKLPLLGWKIISKNGLINFPGEKVFCENSVALSISLTFDEVKNLIHSTSADALLKILLNAEDGCITLIPKSQRDNPGDVAPKGLVYCSVDISSKSITNKYALENRYGVFELRFRLPEVKEKNRKYFFLGTKKYFREYSQQLLVAETNQSNWWVYDESGLKNLRSLETSDGADDENEWIQFKITASNTASNETLNNAVGTSCAEHIGQTTGFKKVKHRDDKMFPWHVLYDNSKCWTHPELVVSGSLKIPFNEGLQIRFAKNHKCVIWPYCDECGENPKFKSSYAIRLDAIKRFAKQIIESKGWKKIKKLQEKFEIFDVKEFDELSSEIRLCETKQQIVMVKASADK